MASAEVSPSFGLHHVGCTITNNPWIRDLVNFPRVVAQGARGDSTAESGFAHATEILDLIHRKKLSYLEASSAIQYSDYSRKKGQSLWNSLNIVFDLLMEKLFR